MIPSLPLLSCESSMSVKENPDRKKNRKDFSFILTIKKILKISENSLKSTFVNSHNFINYQSFSNTIITTKILTQHDVKERLTQFNYLPDPWNNDLTWSVILCTLSSFCNSSSSDCLLSNFWCSTFSWYFTSRNCILSNAGNENPTDIEISKHGKLRNAVGFRF